MKKKPKEYNIETVEDMFNCITEKNAKEFLNDFSAIVASWLLFKSAAKSNKVKRKDINCKQFTWIDDGKHKIDIILKPIK